MRLLDLSASTIAGLGLSAVAVTACTQQSTVAQVDVLAGALEARTNVLVADLLAAQQAGRVSPTEGAEIRQKLSGVQADSGRYVREQGFLSAGESASYNRALDEVERRLR